MANTDHNALLDQLQSNVNLVLEQSGRVFAAMRGDSSKPPTAHINKLKQIVPKAHDDFNDALDNLEEKLQLAQRVMRRDLALWRERAGLPDQSAIEQQPPQLPATEAQPNSATEQAIPTSDMADQHIEVATAPIGEVAMEDSQPEEASAAVEQPGLDVDMAESTSVMKTGIPAATAEATVENEASQDPVTRATAQSASPDAKKPESALQVDTTTDATEIEKAAEDEKVPDTAKESVNNDLDSLFGGGDTTNDATNEFNFDENANGELDFGDFTQFSTDNGDNDNISSLLPGLEDYANTQTNNSSGAELDLNSFFNTNGNDQNDTSAQQDNNNNNNSGDQHDTTFDDLMDLNFDGPDMNDANNTADLDFDSLFN